jgi:Na+-transporting NADH:ubiquinone oxidoreductase subunit NqrD
VARAPGAMMLEMSRWIKENGLLIANLALFAAFFVGMIICGVQVYNADQG